MCWVPVQGGEGAVNRQILALRSPSSMVSVFTCEDREAVCTQFQGFVHLLMSTV